MSCVITYKGNKYTQEQFKEYISSNKNEFSHIIASNENVIDSFKRKMEGIDYVFSQSPELALIGSKAQYLQYLSTIFKTSKVKDIVYHGTTDEKLEKFESYENEVIPNIVHFSKNKKDAEHFSEGVKIIPAIINHNTPVISKEDFDNTSEENYNKLLEQGTFIGANFEHVVKDKSKIHILGSKQDIERFKKFVSNQNNDIQYQLPQGREIEEFVASE